MSKILTCIMCGEPLPNNRARAFCSLDCRKKFSTIAHAVKLSDEDKNKTKRKYSYSGICSVCGTPFKANNSTHFCSQSCQKKAEKLVETHKKRYAQLKDVVRVLEYKHTCPICDKEFVTSNKTQVYCSVTCRLQALSKAGIRALLKYNTKQRSWVSDKKTTCVVCGKEFMSNSAMAKYCSPECRINHLISIGKMYKKKCIVCGKEFVTPSTRQKYCSYECRKYISTKEGRKFARTTREQARRIKQSKLEQIRDRLILEAMELHVSYGQLKTMYARKGIDPFEEVRRY